jgi:glyoxylate carboligase
LPAFFHAFEAAFPYQETPDQERVIAEIKRDMDAAVSQIYRLREMKGLIQTGLPKVSSQEEAKEVVDKAEVAEQKVTKAIKSKNALELADAVASVKDVVKESQDVAGEVKQVVKKVKQIKKPKV